LRELSPHITRWHLCSLSGARGASAKELESALRACGASAPFRLHERLAEGLGAAAAEAAGNDKIVVFGSFLTVGEATAWLQKKKKTSTP